MKERMQDTMKKSERISISNNGTTIDHKTSDENEKEQIKSETDEIAIKIESALEDLNVPGKITHIKHGPRVSLYAILLARYVSLRDFKNAKEDLAFRLGVNAVRILAPIPYTPYVGIEVPNKELVSVSFRDITENPEAKSLLASGLSALLGRDLSGNLVACDLKKQGHLLVAGEGKASCLCSVIASIISHTPREQVRFLIIDTTVVELSSFSGISRLCSPIINDYHQAFKALENIYETINQRYDLFFKHNVRDIDGYNQLSQEYMPQIVVLVNDLADLMLIHKSKLDDLVYCITRIGKKAGIHLLVATSRCSPEVVTSLIKSNISSRVCLKTTSFGSRVILDTKEANDLMSNGDMLFLQKDDIYPTRIQGCEITDEEISQIVNNDKLL